MSRRTVVVTVGAREYKVVSSASEEELMRLAQTVSAKLAEVAPQGRPEPPQALLLAALALAHDLEEERAALADSGLLRVRPEPYRASEVSFCSNDYLGLAMRDEGSPPMGSG